MLKTVKLHTATTSTAAAPCRVPRRFDTVKTQHSPKRKTQYQQPQEGIGTAAKLTVAAVVILFLVVVVLVAVVLVS